MSRKYFSSVLTLVILGSSFLMPPATADDSSAQIVQPDDCLPAVLMLRGSDEYPRPTNIDPSKENGGIEKWQYKTSIDNTTFIETNNYEGQKFRELLQPFVDQTNPALTVSKVRFIGIDYEALDVLPNYGGLDELSLKNKITAVGAITGVHAVKYQNSYNNGALKAIEKIRDDQARGCETQYMLMGYSQGAISARIAIDLLGEDTNKIHSTYLVGDPLNDGSKELSTDQISPAHAQSDMDGVLRSGLTSLRNTQLANVLTLPFASKTNNYLKKLTNADSLIYRDSVSPSRVLCHDGDIICDFMAGSNMDHHNNYFNTSSQNAEVLLQGQNDLIYEVEAFDQQVQNLANSQSHNPRARVLKKTPSVNTSTTLYNLANAQPGDTCSWDEGNNGTYEATDIPCEVYEYANSSKIERLRVKVTDSYGSNYFFELEDEVLEVEQIEHVLTLDPNSWYQFKVKEMPLTEKDRNNGYYYDDEKEEMVLDKYWEPSFTGDQCVEWFYQDPFSVVDDYHWNMDLVDCKEVLRSGNAFDAMQVFKPSKEGVKSGYDDDYSWGRDSTIEEYLTLVPHADNNETFKPILTEIIDNIPYYSFRNQTNCVTAKDNEAGYTNLFIETCMDSSNAQLFEARKINGNYGSLSLEKDTTPPKEPNNVLLEVDHNGLSMMIWDKVEDRGIETTYELYKVNSNPTRYNHYDTYYSGEVRAKDLYAESIPLGQSKTYAIRALDEKGLYSPYAHITVNRITEPVRKPTKPILSTITEDNTNVTLSLPTYDTSKIRGVRVYDNDEYLGTHTGSMVNLPVLPGTTHTYYYRYEVNDQIVSVPSNKLKVIIPASQ